MSHKFSRKLRILLPNKQIITYDNKDYKVYQIINEVYNELPSEYKIQNWSYNEQVTECFYLEALEGEYQYTSEEVVVHQYLALRQNFKWNKSVIDIIQTNPKLYLDKEQIFQEREVKFCTLLDDLNFNSTSIFDNYNIYGCNKNVSKGLYCFREWIPFINYVSIIGDFNNWDILAHPMKEESKDTYYLELDMNLEGCAYLLYIETFSGEKIKKMSPWTKSYKQEFRSVEGSGDILTNVTSHILTMTPSVATQSEMTSQLKPASKDNELPIIYEAHVGLAKQSPPSDRYDDKTIGSYDEFIELLTHIRNSGYNTIQLMGVLEHPYYNSFGYQPNFIFAPSSRFGNIDGLKRLINQAHTLGLRVILDVIQGHSVTNTTDGINCFNGNFNCFFNDTDHPKWNTKMFLLSDLNVVSYLLSNLTYWVKEFGFDGFRFDAVTAMLFRDYGAHKSSLELASDFFTHNVNVDGLNYLRLANQYIHNNLSNLVGKKLITIAEDVSNFPGITCPQNIGFDVRLGMHTPDIIQKIYRTGTEEPIYKQNEFDLEKIYSDLTSNSTQRQICYLESHDQAFVGSRTLFETLTDGCDILNPLVYRELIMERRSEMLNNAMLSYMMMRMLCMSLSYGGFLDFMGNEFAHPQWVEFPTEKNEFSYDRCTRKWHLFLDKNIFRLLYVFNGHLLSICSKSGIFNNNHVKSLQCSNEKQVLIYMKNNLIFVFNFHSKRNGTIRITGVPNGTYITILSNQSKKFSFDGSIEFGTTIVSEGNSLSLKLPKLCCYILQKKI